MTAPDEPAGIARVKRALDVMAAQLLIAGENWGRKMAEFTKATQTMTTRGDHPTSTQPGGSDTPGG